MRQSKKVFVVIYDPYQCGTAQYIQYRDAYDATGHISQFTPYVLFDGRHGYNKATIQYHQLQPVAGIFHPYSAAILRRENGMAYSIGARVKMRKEPGGTGYNEMGKLPVWYIGRLQQ